MVIRLHIHGKSLMGQHSDQPKEEAELAKFAAKVLNEPLQIRLLSDRVYELLTNELRQQKERVGRNYEGRL
ncbi:hypothetical protein VB774_02080 [Pseudanabaena galeata UHCC 0370]|uniref:Uncharacterized protein n=2 Tax=Pseudanabaena TaxID=1152 RepID=A0ABU5TE39_9CYAN|nr:hypothetical protein [Pseudanabaena galeata]MEA5476397.1 hypothetical protein [Pseudanabaena galeata UHCC 0370]WGS72527.1 hypothetical protein OA858_00450 [Pseudanabaena galeata CCNP1313]